MSTADSIDGLFQEAARQFRGSLSPHDSEQFAQFSSAKEMIQELNRRVSVYQKKSKLVVFCQRLDRVSESLSPFFDIIGIFIQSNPEITALFWGAIRMVFLLASNFSSFLDKLLVMFEKLGDRLPGYTEYHQRLLDRQVFGNSDLGIPKFESTRVLKVLSYIYKDLLQFCQEACQVFGTKSRRVRYTAAAIIDIFWKPFDVRFKSILERIETHQALFLSEMQLEESKFTEFQFRKRELDANETNEAISKLKMQVSELRKTILDIEQALIDRFEHIQEHVASLSTDKEERAHRGNVSPQRVAPIFDATFRQIAKWINASDFSSELHKAQNVRLDDTGKWFLTSSCYLAFKSLAADPKTPMESSPTPPKHQIMFIKGKPGYGKTILSSLLIEDLATPSKASTYEAPEAPNTLPVLYYHFASERVDECTPTHGLRACLHQIMHRNAKSTDFLDAVSLIADTDGTGQMRATDEDIVQCLHLLLAYQSEVTLVFDGLDECTNQSDLFETVYELCHRTGTKAIFLGRPSYEPPRRCSSYVSVTQEPWQNVNDIRIYLQPEIESLIKDCLLPEASDPQEIVTLLSCRAQGMFLWAMLVVRYLSNTWLSPRERADAIFDDTMLDGLENLYERILTVLERSHPAQQEKVHRIFQVIAISRVPFTLLELRQIVALTPGKVTREEDFIVDFEHCLPIMCGALVECDSGGPVRFIHSSLREYLVESKYRRDSRLAITKQHSWLTLTTICLSYLTYDIPRGPITTSSRPRAKQHTLIAKCFPLLRYGILRLQQDDVDIFATGPPTSNDEINQASGLLRALEEWIKERLCVTAWIEANFYSQRLPTLEPIMSMMGIWRERYDAHRARIDANLRVCSRLEEDLTRLRNDWAKVLFEEPCAIWTSTVTAFTKSLFWFTQNDTTITHLDERPKDSLGFDRMGDHTLRTILLKSQTAADKMSHATIHVIPSRQYLNIAKRRAKSDKLPLIYSMGEEDIRYMGSDWKARYEIKDISSQSILFSATLDLPTTDVLEVLKIPIDSDPNEERMTCSWRFSFPVAISSDLQRILILRTLVSLRLGTVTGEDEQLDTCSFHSQRLRNQNSAEDLDSRYHYGSIFSPMSDAVAFFERKSSNPLSPQLLEIWSTTASKMSRTPTDYVFRGRNLMGGMPSRSIEGKTFLFHPTRPCLAYTYWGGGAIWRYNETDKLRKCQSFIRNTIELSSFQGDTFLRYYCWNYANEYEVGPMGADVTSVRGEAGAAHDFDGGEASPSTGPSTPSMSIRRICVEKLLPARVSDERAQDSDTGVSTSNSLTAPQPHTMTTLKNIPDTLQIIQEGPTGQSVMVQSHNGQRAQFGHIPSLRGNEPSSLTVLPIAGSVKVIWDKELQKDYSVLDTPSAHLPCLIERTLQSVPLLESGRSDEPADSIHTGEEHQHAKSQARNKRSRLEDDSTVEGRRKRRHGG